MEEFAYLVNALLKSKIKGHFVMQNGIVVSNVEPSEISDKYFKATIKKDQRLETVEIDELGHSVNRNCGYNIVKFVKE